MTRVHNGLLALTAACAFAFASTACENTRRGMREDTAKVTEAAKDKSEATKAEGRDVASDAKQTAGKAGAAIDAAKETIDVKTALMADDTVDAGGINVDTYHETKTVVLKGTVPTAAQKTAAAQIAAREAVGYKIDNQLTVKPKH